MERQGDSLLEVFGTPQGLRFSFLDRARPSLSFEQILPVPESVLRLIVESHQLILRSTRARLARSSPSTATLAIPAPPIDAIHELSQTIRSFLFPEDFLSHVRDFSPTSLLIRTNLPQIPWELSSVNGHVLGIKYPTGRSLITHRPLKRVSLASPLRQLRVLLIANPTGDLPGADEEASALMDFFSSSPYISADLLLGSKANLNQIVSKLQGNNYDVIHYAGHSDFDPPSGILGDLYLNGGRVSAQYFAKLIERHPPRLFFFNSCNSAFVNASNMLFDDLSGVAPNFLRVGVESIIGATWPVIDDQAAEIAVTFYRALTDGISVGAALNEARLRSLSSTETPYWLGYSLFGAPNQRLIEDFTWKSDSIRSGGAVAAMSTFAGRASIHVSSIHSFLMSAEDTDTCVLALACECWNSEAVVFRNDTDLQGLLQQRTLKLGLPGKTGSAIYLRKVVASLPWPKDRVRFVELDTSEVMTALNNRAIDATVIWQPDLGMIDRTRYGIIETDPCHAYTICVLVGRKPRTKAEIAEASSAIATFSLMASEFRKEPRRWSRLLVDQLGYATRELQSAIDAYDFSIAGVRGFAQFPEAIQRFIEEEAGFLKNHQLLADHVNIETLFWDSTTDENEPSAAESKLVADIQWSVSSAPLILRKFKGYFL